MHLKNYNLNVISENSVDKLFHWFFFCTQPVKLAPEVGKEMIYHEDIYLIKY
jgi:hypothetical protein